MTLLNNTLLQELLSTHESPCVSIYMSTHKTHPENLQDPIKFKNLVKEAEKSLLLKYSKPEIQKLLDQLSGMINNTEIWAHADHGLAVLCSKSLFKMIRMPFSVPDFVIAADSFHTKPLRQYLQSVDRYYVLGLSINSIQLFEGNRYTLTEVMLPDDFPKTTETALGTELSEKHSTVASYGGVAGSGNSSAHHGHGGKKDEVEMDTKRFFRVIANRIYKTYSKPNNMRVILAALPEHHHLYRAVNIDPLLTANGIKVNPGAVSIEALIDRAWEAVEPDYLKFIEELSANYDHSKSILKGSDNLIEVTKAAAEGKVHTLLVEENRILAGKITDSLSGTIKKSNLQDPETDDLLDDIGELVIKMGGEVFVIPSKNMPTTTGLAATYRY